MFVEKIRYFPMTRDMKNNGMKLENVGTDLGTNPNGFFCYWCRYGNQRQYTPTPLFISVIGCGGCIHV
ncbi:hypothetical protein ACA910_010846 [Epithemia clementina (nom. ined.)]